MVTDCTSPNCTVDSSFNTEQLLLSCVYTDLYLQVCLLKAILNITLVVDHINLYAIWGLDLLNLVCPGWGCGGALSHHQL